MEYCVFLEKNQKERESFITYLQYNGNEETLQKLYELVKKADMSDLVGDVSYFEMEDPSIRISQSAVDEHMRLASLGNWSKTFAVARGILTLPFSEDYTEYIDCFGIASLLDKHFYHCRIKDCFNK